MNVNYSITDKYVNGSAVIRIDSGEFSDIEYRYGGVAVDTDNPVLKFDYFIELDEYGELINEDAKTRFQNVIGDILMDMLQSQLDKGEVIYSGGIDNE